MGLRRTDRVGNIGINIRIKAGDALEVESTTIKSPVTGAEVH